MKKYVPFEAVAATLAIIGGIALVSGLVIDITEDGVSSPWLNVLTGILISLPLLGLSWYLNKHAQSTRKKLENPAQRVEAGWEQWLKWIIFVGLVLAILIGFLDW